MSIFKDDKALAIKEVSSLLSVHSSTIRKLLQKGLLNGLKVGRSVRVWQSSLEAYIADNTLQSQSQAAAVQRTYRTRRGAAVQKSIQNLEGMLK